MDKKKVKKLIENTIRFTKASDEDYIHGKVKSHIINTLQVALEELSKSDWVSVEDGLPEYCEKVFAYDKEMQDYPFVNMRYRDWETDRKSTRLNSSHSGESRMPSSA